MNTNKKSFENFDELIFENKNKTYGAYAIRRSYSDNVTKSLIVTLIFFGGFAFLSFWLTNNHEKLPSVIIENVTPLLPGLEVIIDPPKPPEPKPVDPGATPPKSESGLVVASDDKDKTSEKTTDEKQFSKDPNPNGSDSVAKIEDPVVPKLPEEKKPEKIETVVDQVPEFENMGQYISRNLHYPALAREMETKGIVYITFVVEIDGSVSNVEVLKGIGDGCEQEAMRVIKNMPKWKPGINHGKLVRVQCNLPVKFTLQ